MKWMQAITGVILLLLTMLLVAMAMINLFFSKASWNTYKTYAVIQLLLAVLFGIYGAILIKKSNQKHH